MLLFRLRSAKDLLQSTNNVLVDLLVFAAIYADFLGLEPTFVSQLLDKVGTKGALLNVKEKGVLKKEDETQARGEFVVGSDAILNGGSPVTNKVWSLFIPAIVTKEIVALYAFPRFVGFVTHVITHGL